MTRERVKSVKPEENKEVLPMGETSENKEKLGDSQKTVWSELKNALNTKIYSFSYLVKIILISGVIETLIEELF